MAAIGPLTLGDDREGKPSLTWNIMQQPWTLSARCSTFRKRAGSWRESPFDA
jgi:hypothetical protein